MKRPIAYRPFPPGRLALGGLCLALSGTAYAGGLIMYEVGTADVGLASAGYSARAQDAIGGRGDLVGSYDAQMIFLSANFNWRFE